MAALSLSSLRLISKFGDITFFFFFIPHITLLLGILFFKPVPLLDFINIFKQ